MRHYLYILFALLLPLTAMAQRLSPIAPGYAETSVNTAIFRCSALVTVGDTQYVAFYNAQGYVTLGKRQLGTDDWVLCQSQYKGKVSDAHNVISLGVDGEGYLHVSFDHHGNKLRYCRSTEPWSLQLGEMQPMTGKDENDVTYPEFYRLANGDLLFAYRSGVSGRGNLVLNRYSIAQHEWNRVQDVLIDGEQKRNAYWQMFVDAQGTIHVSWVWRETWMVETNHDLCYARSKDGGVTWERSDGSKYTLPITASNAEYACRIPQKSELINQTSMSADAKGNPYIATYWRNQGDSIPQYRMVWFDGKRWRQQQVSRRQQPFSLAGGGTKMIPIARPRMVTDGRRAYYLTRDAERGSKVTLYHTDNIASGKWQHHDLTTFSVNAWEPCIDTELWKQRQQLHVFLQNTFQGDGERTVKAEPEMIYVLEVPTKGTFKPVTADWACLARMHPEFYEDMAWENDRVAFRAYGPKTKGDGYGYDVFTKHGNTPCLDIMYDSQFCPAKWKIINSMRAQARTHEDDSVRVRLKKEAQKIEESITYHIDHGYGNDCYGVGPTFGAGTTALQNARGQLVFPHFYEKYEILSNGPDRVQIRLTFPPVDIDGQKVTEERIITLDRGSQLNHTIVRYHGLTHAMTLMTGIVAHSDEAPVRGQTADGRYFQAYDDPTQQTDGRNGVIRIGHIYPRKPETMTFRSFGKNDPVIRGNNVAVFTIQPDEPFEYWWGYGWSKRDFPRQEQWIEYLKNYSK